MGEGGAENKSQTTVWVVDGALDHACEGDVEREQSAIRKGTESLLGRRRRELCKTKRLTGRRRTGVWFQTSSNDHVFYRRSTEHRPPTHTNCTRRVCVTHDTSTVTVWRFGMTA